MSNETAPTTLETVSQDIATAASVAASIAPALGPYGVLASTALNILEVLAQDAPDAYAVISKAFTGTQPAAADFAALRAECVALSLDS